MPCRAARPIAGPPFLTNDPEPTETGHWDIYGPLVEADGRGGDSAGTTGIELNYGAAPDMQLTVGLPIASYNRVSRFLEGLEIRAD